VALVYVLATVFRVGGGIAAAPASLAGVR
jgi:hypothetical protein